MKFIVSTVEEYVAPAIVYLSDYLNFSESLAGVTLIAFANGAGDVLTAIVASESKDGISYNLGALYGAGLFVLTFVIAMTILNSTEEIKVPKALIYRDILVYIIASILIICIGIYGELNVMNSTLLLVLYVLLVIIVLV